mmetsp:Transcript_12286/g.19354  ORF Transcript_12286/g.19354 Transcript_12286/m.19354 type:complete len:152 (-) Transcript_12286:1074-1529(-)
MGNSASRKEDSRLCSFEDVSCFGICNPKSGEEELAVVRQGTDITFQDAPAAEFSPQKVPVVSDGRKYGLGILWLVRSEKLIVCGFVPGSTARKQGVKCGDILKSVDAVDMLHFKTHKGRHPAGEYMVGDRATVCQLELLRVCSHDTTTAGP